MAAIYINHGTVKEIREYLGKTEIIFSLNVEEEVYVEENYSNVTISLYARTGAGQYNLAHEGNISLGGINGTWRSFTYNKTVNTQNTLLTQQAYSNIAHNVNGAYALSIKGWVRPNNPILLDTVVELYDIPKGATITCNDVFVGDLLKIGIARFNSEHLVSIKCVCGLLEEIIVEGTKQEYLEYMIGKHFYDQFPNSDSIPAQIIASTYDGKGNLVDTFTKQILVKALYADCKPTFTAYIVDGNTVETGWLTGGNDVFILGYTNAYIEITPTARNGASIARVVTKCGSKNLPLDVLEGTIPKVDSSLVEITVYDSRGFSTYQKYQMKEVPYVNLTCNLVTTDIDPSGNAKLTVKGNAYFGSFGKETNNVYFLYRYRESGGEFTEWDYPSSVIKGDGTTYTVEISFTGLDYKKDYDFEVRAIDSLQTIDSAIVSRKATTVFDWSANDFNFNVPVTITQGDNSYNLLGLAKAMTTTYTFPTSTYEGSNYKAVNTTNAVLIGNMLRCYFMATRESATGDGNPANETVATFSIEHGGKIRTMYNIAFCSGATGAAATFQTTNATNEGGTLTFDIELAGTSAATTTMSGFFIVPVTLNLDSFV